MVSHEISLLFFFYPREKNKTNQMYLEKCRAEKQRVEAGVEAAIAHLNKKRENDERIYNDFRDDIQQQVNSHSGIMQGISVLSFMPKNGVSETDRIGRYRGHFSFPPKHSIFEVCVNLVRFWDTKHLLLIFAFYIDLNKDLMLNYT